MKIVCILNSPASFERIKNEIHIDEVEWQHETSLDRLRLTLATDYYDLAIIDRTINDIDNFTSVFELKKVNMVFFNGKFDEVIADTKRKIDDYLREEQEFNESYNKQTEIVKEITEPVKVMVKEVVKTHRVEIPVIQDVANKLISVVNLSERAGSTFIATNLARAIAHRDIAVTLYENPIGNLDAYYAMGFYDESKSYYSYHEAMHRIGRVEKEKLPCIQGVSIAVNEPNLNYKNWEVNDTLRLFASYSGINIVDLGWEYSDESIIDILKISHIVLVVIDPISTQIVRNEERLLDFRRLKEEGVNIQYVFNKWDDSINLRVFSEGFDMNPLVTMPSIPVAEIYKTFYKPEYEFLVDHKDFGTELINAFSPILNDFKSDAAEEPKKRRGLFSFVRK